MGGRGVFRIAQQTVHGHVDIGGFEHFAFGAQVFEFLDFAFEMTLQARLLQGEVRQRFAARFEDLGFDEERVGIGIGLQFFSAASGIDGGFEHGNAQEAPLGVGDFLDDEFFDVSDRRMSQGPVTPEGKTSAITCRLRD